MIAVAAKNANRQPQSPDGFHIRAASFQPVRAAYVREVLLERLSIEPAGKRALVVGAGRGLLARELVRLGFAVAALDPNPDAARLGRETCARQRLAVDYEVGDAGRLPYADASFDVGYWADTLEIAPQLDVVLAEAARILRPGGVVLYDTVTRTALSRLIYLGTLQSWRCTRIMPRDRYAWDRLRHPDDLARTLAEHGLRSLDVRGFLPASPVRLLRATRRARRGDIDDAELAQLAGMRLAPGSARTSPTSALPSRPAEPYFDTRRTEVHE